MATGQSININSPLLRKKWLMEGMVQAADKSFWTPLTSGDKRGIVYQVNNSGASDGNSITFDYSGNMAGTAVKGDTVAYGQGEEKRKFNSQIEVERYRIPVANGNRFHAKAIGDLLLPEHGHSRMLLADSFMRFKDQSIWDTVQSVLGTDPSHVFTIANTETFDFNMLIKIEAAIKTSTGLTGGIRRPLDPYMMKDNMPCWLFCIDTHMAAKLKQDPLYQTLVVHGDLRGDTNRVIKGVIGKLGSLIIVEAAPFFGKSRGTSATAGYGLDSTTTEIAGMRRKDTNSVWTGQEGYISTGEQTSRGVLLGAGAVQLAMGMEPDYLHQVSTDYATTSESAVEFHMAVQKTILKADNSDYVAAKIVGTDLGAIPVDCRTQT